MTGLAHPPASAARTRLAVTALAGAAFVLAVSQAVGVGLTGASAPPRADVLADTPHQPQTSSPVTRGGTEAVRAPGRAERSRGKAAADGPAAAARAKPMPGAPGKPAAAMPEIALADGPSAAAAPAEPAPSKPAVAGPESSAAPAGSTPSKPAVAGPGKPLGAKPSPATPGTPAPAGLAPPAAPSPAVLAAARSFVRDYYAALNAHDFTAAWKMLSPAVRSRFGSFASWRQGYARTISHSPGGISVTALGGVATVGLTLRAGDRDACGRTVERRFAVTWRLARTDAGWRATAASARKLSGPEPC